MKQADLTGGTGSESGPCLSDHRIEPVDERNRCDDSCAVGAFREVGGFGRGDGEGLLTDHVLARRNHRSGEVGMRGVGGAHVNDVDVRIAQQRVEILGDEVDPETLRGFTALPEIDSDDSSKFRS